MKSNTRSFRRLAAAFATTAAVSLLLGCSPKGSKQMQVLREGNEFVGAYLNGDVESARRNLTRASEFFQSPRADVLEPSGHAGIVYFTYARLYALETRTGNKAAGEAALFKARFWNEKRYALAGATSPTGQEECRLFSTPEKIIEVADKLDSSATSGRGPNYIHDMQKR